MTFCANIEDIGGNLLRPVVFLCAGFNAECTEARYANLLKAPGIDFCYILHHFLA